MPDPTSHPLPRQSRRPDALDAAHARLGIGPEPQPVYLIDLLFPASCDWGDCDGYAVVKRWSREHGWLPVCEAHKEGS